MCVESAEGGKAVEEILKTKKNLQTLSFCSSRIDKRKKLESLDDANFVNENTEEKN